jgi:uncharacterized small protein (DUF1192 family)
LQQDVDVKALRIRQLEGVTLEDEKLDLDDLEQRIQFLIGLLEKCRTQLEKEADKEEDAEAIFSQREVMLESQFRIERECSQNTIGDSFDNAVREFYRGQVN